MEYQYKLSVIVPCYNASLLIDRAMSALENQTIGIGNMQIILVNDCSTDATLGKLLQWERKYPDNIVVIPLEENVLQGAARNIALQYVTGKYIGFIDADDFIEPDAFESAYNAAEKYNAEIVTFLWKPFREFSEVTAPHKTESGDMDDFWEIHDYASRKQMFMQGDVTRSCWGKLYLTEFIKKHNFRFAEGVFDEEALFTMTAFLEAKRVYNMQRYFYWYRQSFNNTTFYLYTNRHRNDNAETWLQVYEKLKEDGVVKKNYELVEYLFFYNYFRVTLSSNVPKGHSYDAETINEMKKKVLYLFPQALKNNIVNDSESGKAAVALFKEEVTDSNAEAYNNKWLDFYKKYGF